MPAGHDDGHSLGSAGGTAYAGPMKKFLFALAVAGGVAVVIRQYNRKTAEADLWAEATDHISPASH